ncbi:hypothetical protein [Pseudoflavitalea rhizosphaerae]|uniref:hypothetical protein n=1 Tax=Pseudoflavitalea rhizosphaerae TaxID=1884793 RepID=UPI000F8DD18C|nr:hypothetical protein [Pseudoflavitalea rhizosphaerae]
MSPLKTTLLVNAISSGATGLLLALFPGMAAGIFGISDTVYFVEVGIFLVLFAAFVVFVATRKPVSLRAVMLVTTLDLLWVLVSIVAVFLLAGTISTIGSILIIAVAAWVALMAFLQFKGTYAVKSGI